MINLPVGPMQATPIDVDAGFFQRGISGLITDRIGRKGSHFKLAVSAGPFPPHIGRGWVADLAAGKREGARMAFPLQWSQGSPGSPVVDGADQEGTSLVVRGLTPGYTAMKGYILSIENASGQHFVHMVKTLARANGAGEATLVLTDQLRYSFADGATIHLGKPKIEGWIEGNEMAWEASVNQVIPISFTIEEAA